MSATDSDRLRATTFLAHFNEIELVLKKHARADNRDSFTWMVRQALKDGLLTGNQADALVEFSQLRNAIAHGRYSKELLPIAIPLPETVEHIGRIRSSLTSPKRALDFCLEEQQRPPITFEPGTRLQELFDAHGSDHIAKFPIYTPEHVFSALLTASNLFTWVAARGANPAVTAGEIIAHAPQLGMEVRRCHFLPKTASIQKALTLLSTPTPGNRLPQALIISEAGLETQKPLGIISGSDAQGLLRYIEHPI